MNGFRIALAGCVLLALSHAPARAEHLQMGVGDWCPYVCDPPLADGREGYLVDLFREVLEHAGVSVQTQFLPFARNIQMNRAGALDGIIGVYRSDARDFYFPQTPQGIGQSEFFTLHTSTWRYRGPSDLTDVGMLGSVYQYEYGSPDIHRFIQQTPEKNRVVTGSDPQRRLIQLLLRERVRAFIEDSNVARYNIASFTTGSHIRSAGTVDDPLPVYVVFTPTMAPEKAAKYLEILEQGVDKMRASGRLAEILAPYGVSDWQQ